MTKQRDYILLDRSGSMSGLWAEAVSSVNGYVKKLAEDKVETEVTLAVFDGQGGLQFTELRTSIKPGDWKDVTPDEAAPRGMTPLSDATGRIVSMAEAAAPERCAIIIMTDGMENDSRELSVEQAKKKLDDCRAKNWQVVFLGANFDNARQGAAYGNADASTVQMAPGKIMASLHATAVKRGFYGATGQSVSFSDEEKEEAKK